jgi:hypothetical protein
MKIHRKDWFFKAVRRGDPVKATTPWEECYQVCWNFKKKFRKKSKKEIVGELQCFSMVVLSPSKSHPYRVKRERKFATKQKCFVCKISKAFYFHHIILLKNNGFNSGINRIPICEDCHKEVHSWLV